MMKLGATRICTSVRSVNARAGPSHYRLICPTRSFHSSTLRSEAQLDPRLEDLGKVIRDEYAVVRDSYDAPKNPVVLAHGLFGFDTLRLAGRYLPGVQYWRGITEALSMKGVEVITATVPRQALLRCAPRSWRKTSLLVRGGRVLILLLIACGLDSRYMISRLKPTDFKVLSLTTIATPHRGSSIADYAFSQIGGDRLAQMYYALEQLKVETGAFSQLTREYMENTFNPATPDIEDVRYFSYGAAMQPKLWSVFRLSHRILQQIEGYNDGLVSVASSRWGGPHGYKGTLVDVSHLDLINWTNRLKWLVGEITGNRRRFNAIAFYLDIAGMLKEVICIVQMTMWLTTRVSDMLAKEGL
ncbi:alpha/beta-hydrolase [Aspergillus campestris IBT 28561]|uniref:Alpha/beta-hydrolase n=1 Tax=Aspergillus campestris (strain IBT 28561) TaxID=1392248 RepID=A0A2I1CSK6_ASPC2|nr:alpha/beta-hydrolase [Aspergillus campestris IBT 28561]PKY00606.1 alpha/beta-hydrolase [Aspergillus campestris IBT 28561]